MMGSTLQQLSDTWPYGQMQQIRERERRAQKKRESRLHVSAKAKRGEHFDGGQCTLLGSAETERQAPRRVRHSASDRLPERTQKGVERVDRNLERMDMILQRSLGQARMR